jgi:nucleobase:cation symporter-1, NCS1 family
VIALAASADFLTNFRNFILALLMVFTPWSAINLIDYYLISRERVDVPALYDPAGRYGRWNVVALVSFAVGIVVQIPFLAQTLYTGPLTKALGGADISWLVGLVVTAAVFYPWAKRTFDPPDRMIYPAGTDVAEAIR